MKPLNTNELRQKSLEELTQLSDELRRQTFDLRFQHYTGQLNDCLLYTSDAADE